MNCRAHEKPYTRQMLCEDLGIVYGGGGDGNANDNDTGETSDPLADV